MKRILALVLILFALLSPGGTLPVSAQGCEEIEVIGFETIEQGDCTRLEIALGCGRQETGFCYIEVCGSGSGFSAGCTLY